MSKRKKSREFNAELAKEQAAKASLKNFGVSRPGRDEQKGFKPTDLWGSDSDENVASEDAHTDPVPNQDSVPQNHVTPPPAETISPPNSAQAAVDTPPAPASKKKGKRQSVLQQVTGQALPTPQLPAAEKRPEIEFESLSSNARNKTAMFEIPTFAKDQPATTDASIPQMEPKSRTVEIEMNVVELSESKEQIRKTVDMETQIESMPGPEQIPQVEEVQNLAEPLKGETNSQSFIEPNEQVNEELQQQKPIEQVQTNQPWAPPPRVTSETPHTYRAPEEPQQAPTEQVQTDNYWAAPPQFSVETPHTYRPSEEVQQPPVEQSMSNQPWAAPPQIPVETPHAYREQEEPQQVPVEQVQTTLEPQAPIDPPYLEAHQAPVEQIEQVHTYRAYDELRSDPIEQAPTSQPQQPSEPVPSAFLEPQPAPEQVHVYVEPPQANVANAVHIHVEPVVEPTRSFVEPVQSLSYSQHEAVASAPPAVERPKTMEMERPTAVGRPLRRATIVQEFDISKLLKETETQTQKVLKLEPEPEFDSAMHYFSAAAERMTYTAELRFRASHTPEEKKAQPAAAPPEASWHQVADETSSGSNNTFGFKFLNDFQPPSTPLQVAPRSGNSFNMLDLIDEGYRTAQHNPTFAQTRGPGKVEVAVDWVNSNGRLPPTSREGLGGILGGPTKAPSNQSKSRWSKK